MNAEPALMGAVIVVLTISALLAIRRIIQGPTVMDRAVASDVLVSIIVCALGVEAAITRDSTTLPILISLSLVGFLASVAVARFMSHDAYGVAGVPERDLAGTAEAARAAREEVSGAWTATEAGRAPGPDGSDQGERG